MAYNTDMRPGESIESYYHRIAKVADQRLLRLERLSEEKGFEKVEEYAYRVAQSKLDVWGGKRFNTKIPESASLRNEKIADMLHFIESPTSTKGGITNIYQKRADTLNREYGLDVSWQKLGKIMEAYHDESGKGSTKTEIKAIGVINDIKKEGIEAAMKKNQNMSDDVVMQAVKNYLSDPKAHSEVLKALRVKTGASAILEQIELMGL